jgi:hemerythrin superfamily protein
VGGVDPSTFVLEGIRGFNKGVAGMDAISLLKNDHRKVEKIFSQIEKGTGNREQLFTELATELTVHAEIEEKLFYPAVKDAKQTHDLVLESFEEHKQVKMVLADLGQADKTTETWLAGLKVLMEDVEHHVGEEENDLFPKVSKILSEQELKDLGARMEAMKMRELATVKKA